MCRFAAGGCSCSGIGAWGAAVFACTVAALSTARAEPNRPIPNFAPDNITGWLKGPGDEFLQPASGPGPVRSDPAHPYVSNAVARQETVKIADLTNPILQPWVIEQMRKPTMKCLPGKSASRRDHVAGRTAFLAFCFIRSIQYFSSRHRRKF
jgi:hypothetical protein